MLGFTWTVPDRMRFGSSSFTVGYKAAGRREGRGHNAGCTPDVVGALSPRPTCLVTRLSSTAMSPPEFPIPTTTTFLCLHSSEVL
ncbi:hypothetical protein EYF80_061330 [Liparis tanakae]|uniref:Uncharacterized protein n=1 Tax=Liparis tanakae TaxID=230148 RepID=A0A4Z2EJK5_9TELE|nr:hypothetical protein EYF80_061330 [Liparis tanakae]